MNGRIGKMEQTMEDRVRLLEARLDNLNLRNNQSNLPPSTDHPGQTSSLVSQIGGHGVGAHVEALECCLDQVLDLMLPHVGALLTELEKRIPILQALSHWSPLSEFEAIPSTSISSPKKGKMNKRKKKPLSGHIASNMSAESPIQYSIGRNDHSSYLHNSTSKETPSSQMVSPDSTVIEADDRNTTTFAAEDRATMSVEEVPTQANIDLSSFANALNNSLDIPLQPVPTSSALAAQRLASERSSNFLNYSINDIDFGQIVVPSVNGTTDQALPRIQAVSSPPSDGIVCTNSAVLCASSTTSMSSQQMSTLNMTTGNGTCNGPNPRPSNTVHSSDISTGSSTGRNNDLSVLDPASFNMATNSKTVTPKPKTSNGNILSPVIDAKAAGGSLTTRIPSLESKQIPSLTFSSRNYTLSAPKPRPSNTSKSSEVRTFVPSSINSSHSLNPYNLHSTLSSNNYTDTSLSFSQLLNREDVPTSSSYSSNDDYLDMNPVAQRFKIGSMLGNISFIREGLDAGVNINIQDEDGQTALHWASWNGHEDIVELLVRRGADLEVRNVYGLSALHMAAYGGNAQCVAFMVDADVNINARSSDQKTPLHLAACKGNESVVIVLVAAGADLDLVDRDWNTALDLAATNTIRKLLQPERS